MAAALKERGRTAMGVIVFLERRSIDDVTLVTMSWKSSSYKDSSTEEVGKMGDEVGILPGCFLFSSFCFSFFTLK